MTGITSLLSLVFLRRYLGPGSGFCGRHGGLMVSAHVAESSGLGSSPRQGHYSHRATLHPGVEMGSGDLKVIPQK